MAVASAINEGTKGTDFLVLIDDDEMKGYGDTELEIRFGQAVQDIEKYLEHYGIEEVSCRSDIVQSILCSLVNVQAAVDAYRSRMFAYATDWGSEVSPVGNWSRKLQDLLDTIIKQMSVKDRDLIYQKLPTEVRNKTIQRVYWTSNDRHDSKHRSIKSILFPE